MFYQLSLNFFVGLFEVTCGTKMTKACIELVKGFIMILACLPEHIPFVQHVFFLGGGQNTPTVSLWLSGSHLPLLCRAELKKYVPLLVQPNRVAVLFDAVFSFTSKATMLLLNRASQSFHLIARELRSPCGSNCAIPLKSAIIYLISSSMLCTTTHTWIWVFLDSLFSHSTHALTSRHLFISLKQLITWLNHMYKRSVLIVESSVQSQHYSYIAVLCS